MKKQIILNILSNYTGRVIGMLIGFFLLPFLVGKLGTQLFGLIILFEGLFYLVETVSTSVRMSLARFATYSLSQNKEDEFISFLSTGRLIFLTLAAVVFFAGMAASRWLPILFRVPDEHHWQCQVFFAFLAGAMTITIPNIVFWAGLYAKQRFDLINLSSSTGVIVRGITLITLFTVLPAPYVNLITYGIVFFVMSWTQNTAVYWWFKKIYKGLSVPLNRFDVQKAKKIISFSFYTMSSHMSQMFSENIIQWMINRFWGPQANAIYGVGMKFPTVLDATFLEPTWTLSPTFTDLAARNEKEKLRQFLTTYSKAMAIVTIPICFGLMLFSKSLIRLWVGPGFDLSAVIMSIVLLGHLIHIPTAAVNDLPNAYGRVKGPGIVNVLFSAASIVLSFILSKFFNLGLAGIAWAAAAASLGYCLYIIPYAFNISSLSLKSFMINSFLKPFVWAGIFWAGVFAIIFSISKDWELSAQTIVAILISLPIYFLTSYIWVLTAQDKHYVDQAIHKIRQKISHK